MKTIHEPLAPKNELLAKSQQHSSIIASILLLIIIIAVTAPLAGEFFLSAQFKDDVRRLYLNREKVSEKPFSYQQLDGLPVPVQKYFKHVLPEGRPAIQSVRMLQKGQFKTDIKKDWIDIEGEQYVTTQKPGFVWKGKTYMFSARDMYLKGKGKLVVDLFSFYRLQKGEGPKYDEGELLRWLGESVCYPTNLLPGDNLVWFPIDDESAQLIYYYKGISLSYNILFNSKNEIERMETQRYMADKNKEKWVNKLSSYQLRDGILVPTYIEAGWQLKDGYFPYAKFQITIIEYNKFEMF
ncbi:DUF6920 family protein [Dyadobacter psychrotolerans]|uniref:Uncharacterized protein n=1 Tax=Dyadobacter psychrotolerans TaxID=2541721 RepID=A0A4R5E0G5_9BACT|nr:DUF6544 family protein [Dyadobacter psychrotolerans]TDE17991.1 hypothetical protein E0F88_00050 [Dyadobacter psychrotolerans]